MTGMPTDSKRPIQAIIREGRVKIGPELAERILEEANYEGQRKTYPHHVTLLADSMRRNRWSPGSQIAFGYYDGRLYLVNGRHRMCAVIESGRTIEFQVLITDAPDPETLDSLYYRYDVALRQRSVTEVLNATGVSHLHGLSRQMTKACYEAAVIIVNGLERPRYQTDPVKTRSVDARLEAAEPWWPIAGIYEQSINTAPKGLKSKMMSSGVTAVGLITTKYQPKEAFEFWNGIAENDGLRKGDPRSTFINAMMERKLNSGNSAQSVIIAALAWNAFFEGRTLKIIKVHQNSRPVIKGTPFANGGK